MAKTNNLTDFLTGLADKFRSKLGGTALINPQSFESKIDEVYQKGYDDAPKGTDVSDTTATAADVLQGKIFYGADGVSQKGTIVEQSSLYMGYSSQIFWQRPLVEFKPAENGYITTDSSLMVLGTNLANGIGLTADKILKGKKVLYLDGTATSDATATAADILSGKTAYVNGVKLTGTAATGVDVSDTTATAADVVSSKVFYGADGTKQTGEVYVMDRLAGRITNDGGTISGGSVTDDSNGTIGFYSDPYGFPLYLKGTGGFSVDAPYSVVAQAIGLTEDKIVSGNTILGVNGMAAIGVPNTIEVGHNQYSDNGNGAITLTSDSALPFLFVAKAILPNGIGNPETPGFVTAVLHASWDSMVSGSFVELQSGTNDTIEFSFDSQTKKLQVVDKGYGLPCLIAEYAVIYHSLQK